MELMAFRICRVSPCACKRRVMSCTVPHMPSCDVMVPDGLLQRSSASCVQKDMELRLTDVKYKIRVTVCNIMLGTATQLLLQPFLGS